MKPEPHHAHLTEMRINRWPAIVDALVAVPRSALTSRALQAQRAADREARRLAECYPDPTRRHRAEMELSILEQRHADGLIDARELAARHPDGARRLMVAARKEGRRG